MNATTPPATGGLIASTRNELATIVQTNPLVLRGLDDLEILRDESCEAEPEPTSAAEYCDRAWSWWVTSRVFPDGPAGVLINGCRAADAAIRLDPNYALAYAVRGQCWRGLKDYQNALDDFDMAISLEPASARFFWWRARAWRDMKAYDCAIADLDQAIRLEISPELHVERGEILLELQEFEDALLEFDEAIRICPISENLYRSRALALFESGDRENAFQDFEKAIETQINSICEAPNDYRFDAVDNFIATFPKVFRDRRTVECGRRLCNLTKNSYPALHFLAKTLADAAQFDEAVELEKTAIAAALSAGFKEAEIGDDLRRFKERTPSGTP